MFFLMLPQVFGQAPALTEIQQRADEQIQQLRSSREERLLGLRTQYVGALRNLQQRLGAANDFDGAAEVSREIEQVEGGTLDANPATRRHPELQNLTRRLRGQIVEIENEHSRDMRAAVAHYQRGAQQVAQQMQREGRREEAQTWTDWAAGLEQHLRGLRAPEAAVASAAAGGGTGAAAVVPAAGLILHYTFQDEAVRDQSPRGNHGTLHGGAFDVHGHGVNAGSVLFHQAHGRMTRAVRVAEGREFVRINTPVQGLPLNEFTLVVRFRVENPNALEGALIGSEGFPPTTGRPNWSRGWRLTPTKLFWYNAPGVEGHRELTWDLRPGSRWNHLAVVQEAGNLRVILNGRQVAAGVGSDFGPLTVHYDHLYLGNPYEEVFPPRYAPFMGAISSVAIFDRPLPTTELMRMMSDPAAP